MKKIPISTINPAAEKTNGLFDEGCYGCNCDDECCELGCDVDLATLELIIRHKDLIEPLIKGGIAPFTDIEGCFSTGIVEDDDFIGGGYRSTAVRDSDSRCAFHLHEKRGCALFNVWANHKLPKKIIPTICRIYPLTWHRGTLFVDSPIRKLCKIREKPPEGTRVPSLLETQGKEISELFQITLEKK